jgi:choline dehydrogenase-like flavoprotein
VTTRHQNGWPRREGAAIETPLTPQERRLRWALIGFSALFAVFVGMYLGRGLDGRADFGFVANSVTKDGLFLVLALIAAANLRRFGWLTLLVILGHVFLILTLGAMLLAGETSWIITLDPLFHLTPTQFAVTWLLLDVLVVAVLGFLYLRAHGAQWKGAPTETPVWPQERLLRWVLIGFAGLFAGFVGIYLGRGLEGKADFAFVANSVTKDGLFLVLALIAAASLRRFGWLTLLVMLGHVFLAVTLLIMWMAGKTSSITTLDPPLDLTPTQFALAWAGLDIVVVVLLGFLYLRAERARHQLKYMWGHEFETIKALGDVLIDDPNRALTPEQIARNGDDYLSSFNAKGKWKVKRALDLITVYPLLTLPPHLPVPTMERAPRLRFLRRYFLAEGRTRIGRSWQLFWQGIIGVGAQLVYFGYYGDADTNSSVRFRPFLSRPGAPGKVPPPNPARLRVRIVEPDQIRDPMRADVVIVGSGAAGAILAHDLAKMGKQVLVLERGKHVDRDEFEENELSMLSELYSDGALQMSRDLRFAVLQGMCVGGSTVVNNAVCIEAPDEVRQRWNGPDLKAGLDLPALQQSFDHIRSFLNIAPQVGNFSNGALKFVQAAQGFGLQANVVDANIEDCIGCGQCNVGCRFGSKLSMLDFVLPLAQQQFGGRVRIIAQCTAKRIEMDGTRAEAVRCELDDGRTIRVVAEESIVVSAGAIASSRLLQRSGVGRELPVGRNLSFNMATPVTAHFNEKLRSTEGLQISHYALPPNVPECALETWFNPPAMQSLFMPGWFGDHYRNMEHYDEMACGGVVVGTHSDGNARWGLASDFSFEPREEDMVRLIDGAKLMGEMFLSVGATRVMTSTLQYEELKTQADLNRLDRYKTNRAGLSLNSAHPQGGNAISEYADRGVVDSSFRVHGLQNLYVCDASVFPSSITVNPQFTVMALAHLAAPKIGGIVPLAGPPTPAPPVQPPAQPVGTPGTPGPPPP